MIDRRNWLPVKVLSLLALALVWVPGDSARADAIVVNQSMKAPTIAEFFVERDRVRAELEIGFQDFEAFRNLLPIEILERLELGNEPLPERFGQFFQEDFVLKADGEILVPSLNSIEGRPRARRDEVTGESLPASEEEKEVVLFVQLEYPLPDPPPRALTLTPPMGDATGGSSATVGFILYHEGLAVNDFRYLSIEATVDLDWDDPWYSKFRHPNLKRQYDAPIRGFLYAEPFEIRKEIIARPRDLEEWIDLGLEGKKALTPADQEAILEKAAAFLAERCPVTIDGEPANGTLDRIHFVRRSLRQTSVVGPGEELPVLSATIGAIFVYPITGLPQEAAMEWDLFTGRTAMMQGIATDEAGGLPVTVTPDDPVLVWKNYLKNPTVPGLVEIAPPSPDPGWQIPVTAILGLGLVFWLLRENVPMKQRKAAWAGVVILGFLVLVPATRIRVPMGGGDSADADRSAAVVEGLLQNVYRSFDFREESDIYDTLEKSVSGDLLTDVYLEIQRALQLENQGGAKTKVKEVDLVSTEPQAAGAGPGFTSRAKWTVLGSVGHWGHIHQRKNGYEAELTIEPVDGAWKLTGLQLLGEERL